MNDRNDNYLKLIDGPRVSPQTREALMVRAAPDDPDYVSQALIPAEFLTLKHVLDEVIPQAEPKIDLAVRIDKLLTDAQGDGWRYATLPSDLEAYQSGLSLLNEFALKLKGVPFSQLATDGKHSLLDAVASRRLRSPKLDLVRWFEDLRANAVQIYVSHPHTLMGMGYSGIADDMGGFVQIGIGEREAWEPEPV